MNTKTPGALAAINVAIDVICEYSPLGVRSEAAICLDKARAAFAAEHEALKWARNELASLPRSLGYAITHLPDIDSALAAVEVLK